uniref:CB1 cannabinoid receptor-interacting protein 1 n=1 Tax=Parastrongyloides trichosuri TaxID=131310 RepID=A0A0N4ZBJ2_PARTI
MVKLIKIYFSFFAENDNKHPIFKSDGSRFKSSDKTIKFKSDHNYTIFIKSLPILDFKFLNIDGTVIDLNLIKSTNLGEYTATWSTKDIPITKNKTRKDLIIILSSTEGDLNYTLQTKFYDKDDNHHSLLGTELKTIVWECFINDSNEITVYRENFT